MLIVVHRAPCRPSRLGPVVRGARRGRGLPIEVSPLSLWMPRSMLAVDVQTVRGTSPWSWIEFDSLPRRPRRRSRQWRRRFARCRLGCRRSRSRRRARPFLCNQRRGVHTRMGTSHIVCRTIAAKLRGPWPGARSGAFLLQIAAQVCRGGSIERLVPMRHAAGSVSLSNFCGKAVSPTSPAGADGRFLTSPTVVLFEPQRMTRFLFYAPALRGSGVSRRCGCDAH